MQKTYISSTQLLNDSFELARLVIDSGYRPTFLLGIWRGGAPIAIAVHEVLEVCGIPCEHDVVRVSSYKGIDDRSQSIKINSIEYLQNQITEFDRLLIVDDVHDSGLSMQALIDRIKKTTNTTQIKIAVPYYKPNKSKVSFKPDFYVTATDRWLVFPHELDGLDENELLNEKPEVSNIKEMLKRLSKIKN